ncbi:glycoside hydrolase family 85 protein [Wolfiporia cocos MD-104 SS10]|uniref:Glycoside hydrolase family 85 protein n=1 Tax=Wolfiporia cocos (strain MD-104) TaxID=742152 RepID=A0A2H3JHS8_WOLCO|nr:glycoside hydrolase family 85 protein [Wolfiporia cocos MD-104 SS10]
MPLRGSQHSSNVLDDSPYFVTLAELDTWAGRPSAKLQGVLAYHPRRSLNGSSSESRGKLLTCHDYKGGYTESPSGLAYTFNFWQYCDTFIYFAHHRVTIPPSGWTTAAHRSGVKMLGTLIFEGSGLEDCLKLLFGRLPQSRTGPTASSLNRHLPISPHYARLLADLAYQRGFDGYLLNVECSLVGGIEQARALAAWIAILETELKNKVGPHAQVIWYDSVIVDGQLRWQDRLNSYNLPFFIPSSGIFTNYTWPAHYPSLTAQYFLSLAPAIIDRPKHLEDIYIGVDVWGRGQHGGGGFGSYRALSHIDPEFLGLSVALFGHAWTWETEQDKPGFSWETWWDYERKFWLGPAKEGEVVEVPSENRRPGEPECNHGPFAPVASFFSRAPAPNPADLPFLTWFSPGVGRAWFVCGEKVLQTESGWTDLSQNTSLGDMVWPRPVPRWENMEQELQLPKASSELCMDDAWLGGNSLRLSLSLPGSTDEEAFRCLWLPIQSLAITPRTIYEMTVVYKIDSNKSVDFDLGLSMHVLADSVADAFEITSITTAETTATHNGWSKLAIEFVLASGDSADVLASSGFVLGIVMEEPSEPVDIRIHLGAMAVYAKSSSPGLDAHQARILWADFQPAHSTLQDVAAGTLTWEIAASFTPMKSIPFTDREDPQPLWRLENNFPSFAYFNIYVQPHPTGSALDPAQALFIGSTGLDGRANRFYVESTCLPPDIASEVAKRFYVQGVTDRGVVLDWDHCAYVDVPAT